MSIDSLLNAPLTIEHIGDGAADAHGDSPRGEISSTTTTGYVEESGGSEFLAAQETFVTKARIFLRPDASVAAGDVVVASEGRFQVLSAALLTNPRTGGTHHYECEAVRVVG